MKIAGLIFESLAKAGGYEVFTYNLFRALGQRGHEVTLHVPRPRLRKERAFLMGLPFAVRALPPQLGFLRRNAPGLLAWLMRREQARGGYHVWQIMGAHPEATVARGLSGVVPLCLRAHGDDVQLAPEYGYGMRTNPEVDRAIRENLRLMDRVVALTPGLVDDYAALGAPRERICVIPNGISLRQYEKPRDRAAIRQRHGVASDRFCILTVGRNHPKKGFDLIPGIARSLADQGRDFLWLVVGGGTDRLEPELDRLGLRERVRALPEIGPGPASGPDTELPVDELVDLYCMADAFFFPSRLETFGRVILEAMAARTPVVTTDALGCRDVAGLGEFARMVAVDDTAAMTAALAEFMDDPGLRERFAAAGRRQAERHDWQAVAQAYETQYRALCGAT